MTSLYLRFASPLQSWAEGRVSGNVVRTQAAPTRSAIQGMIAAGLGAARGEWPDWIVTTKIDIRVDDPGHLIDEFQTINPRDEDLEYQQRAFILYTGRALGKSGTFTPDAQSKTSIVRRTYLGASAFTVGLRHETHFEELISAFTMPKFVLYLGKKAFAPTFPFVLGVGDKKQIRDIPAVLGTDSDVSGTLVTKRLIQVTADEVYRSEVKVPGTSRTEWLGYLKEELQRPRDFIEEQRKSK